MIVTAHLEELARASRRRSSNAFTMWSPLRARSPSPVRDVSPRPVIDVASLPLGVPVELELIFEGTP